MKPGSKRNIVIAAVWLGAVLASGCLFETRDAAPPTEGGSQWQVPNVPARVFVNMQNGLEDLSGVNYDKSLADEFLFVPHPEDTLRFPAGTFTKWGIAEERQVTQRFLSESSIVTARFSDRVQNIDTVDQAQFDVNYDLILENSVTAARDTFRATARIDMFKGGKGWQVVRWETLQLNTFGYDSWGILRGRNKQQ